VSKWGTNIINGLIAEQNAKTIVEKKKDNAWKDDPEEYAKRTASGDKHYEMDPIITSYLGYSYFLDEDYTYVTCGI